MAAAGDKARFYLEQSIPDLLELERKKIFIKAEISNITKKRSTFEHKINARGAKPADFVRYVEFEVNVESLRSKRAKRLGIKGGGYSGQKRVLFILDRATKKFHGDLGLWMQYLRIAQNQKAFNRVDGIITKLIRMHPTKPEVWIYAATYAHDEHGDMTESRSYMQRGLRFCKNSKEMWLTYAKLELLNISKIMARQKILGLSHNKTENIEQVPDDPDGDMIALSGLGADYVGSSPGAPGASTEDLNALTKTPMLSGAIPIAVFDAAMAHFSDVEVGGQFFDLTCQFPSLPCAKRILGHISDRLMAKDSSDPIALDCFIREPIVGISSSSSAFAQGLESTFARLNSSLIGDSSGQLFRKTVAWMLEYLTKDLNENLDQALIAMLFKTLTLCKTSRLTTNDFSGDTIAAMLEPAVRSKPNIGQLMSLVLEIWPANERLLALEQPSHVEEPLIDQ